MALKNKIKTKSKQNQNKIKLIATELFDETRNRIMQNVLLKFYNFFLVPLQRALATDLQVN